MKRQQMKQQDEQERKKLKCLEEYPFTSSSQTESDDESSAPQSSYQNEPDHEPQDDDIIEVEASTCNDACFFINYVCTNHLMYDCETNRSSTHFSMRVNNMMCALTEENPFLDDGQVRVNFVKYLIDNLLGPCEKKEDWYVFSVYDHKDIASHHVFPTFTNAQRHVLDKYYTFLHEKAFSDAMNARLGPHIMKVSFVLEGTNVSSVERIFYGNVEGDFKFDRENGYVMEFHKYE